MGDFDYFNSTLNDTVNAQTEPLNIVIYSASWILSETLGNTLLMSVIYHEKNNPYRSMLGHVWSMVMN